MNRKWLWTLLGCTAGAVVGLYFFAAYGSRNPETWAGRVNHRICRVIYPSDPTFRALDEMPGATVAVPCDEVVVAEPTPPVPSRLRLTPAPEVVHVFEPIVIETAALEFRGGAEESEFPIIRDLPLPRGVTPPNPPRMPLADEPRLEAPGSSENAALPFSMLSFCSALDVARTVLPANVVPAKSGEEESDTGLECPEFGPMPMDYHHHHCPRTGGYCPPSQYRYFEIPSTNPTMPVATDMPK